MAVGRLGSDRVEMTVGRRRAIALAALATLGLTACSDDPAAESADAEVELNTALGRRGTPSSTDPVVSVTTTAVPTTTSAPGPTVVTSGPSTTVAAPTTTAEPCSEFGSVSVTVSDDTWSLTGRAADGTPIASDQLPLEAGLGRVVGERDFDHDGRPELLVVAEGDGVTSRLLVFEFRRCRLSEPRNPLTGEAVRPVVGVFADQAGGVVCRDAGLEVTTLSAVFDGADPDTPAPDSSEPDTSEPDTTGPAQQLVGWTGAVEELTLFAGAWEVRSSIDLSVPPTDVTEVALLAC